MNGNALLAAIKLQGMSMGDFLDRIKMNRSTWSKKIRGIHEFNRDEIQRIISVLSLNKNEIMDIFFAKEFPKRNN